jgi:hypothetical protein
LGYKGPLLSFGKNVFADKPENWAVNYYGGFQLIQDQFLYQYKENATGSLYNFQKDPLLRQNLATKEKQLVSEMDTRLKAFVQQYHNRLIRNQLLPPAR